MANCIAEATGYDTNRAKDTHRLGSRAAEARAATWRTFATAYINKDGSGYVKVSRNGETLHLFSFNAES